MDKITVSDRDVTSNSSILITLSKGIGNNTANVIRYRISVETNIFTVTRIRRVEELTDVSHGLPFTFISDHKLLRGLY